VDNNVSERNMLSPSSDLYMEAAVSPKFWYVPTSPHGITIQKTNMTYFWKLSKENINYELDKA
jgi:hypothetical protein